jgi:hypothetical protein
MGALSAKILYDKAVPEVAVPFAPDRGTLRTKIQIPVNFDT